MSTHYDVQALPAEQREHILRGFGLGWWRQLGQVAIVFGVVLLACWYVGLLDATTLLNGLPSIATPGRRGHAARLFGLSKLDSPLDRHLGDEHRRYGHRSGVLAGGGLRCSAQYGAAPLVFGVARVLLNALRSVPELIMGIIFVAAVGFGALPGVLALGSAFGRHGQQVLRRGHRARRRSAGGSRSGGGATPMQVLLHAVLPQVTPQFADVAIYRWEYNFRASTVMGMVGAGGIGFELMGSLRIMQYRRLQQSCWSSPAMVTLVDAFSGVLRKRFK